MFVLFTYLQNIYLQQNDTLQKYYMNKNNLIKNRLHEYYFREHNYLKHE